MPARGAGKGFVDVYNTDGSFVLRLATRGVLNAPWGVVIASESFFNDDDEMMKGFNDKNGVYQNDKKVVLIGNFSEYEAYRFPNDLSNRY